MTDYEPGTLGHYANKLPEPDRTNWFRQNHWIAHLPANASIPGQTLATRTAIRDIVDAITKAYAPVLRQLAAAFTEFSKRFPGGNPQ